MSNDNQNMEVFTEIVIPFTQVQNELMDCIGFENPLDKLVYISLLRFAQQKGKAFPSVSKLAMMNGVTPNTIRQSIKRLETMGIIKVKRRPPEETGKVEWSSNIYYILPLTEELKWNSIMNEEAIKQFKEKEKLRKEEKAQKNKKKKKPTVKNEVPTSNFEVPEPTSNFEVPTSNFEVPTSNFEQEEYIPNNNHLINTKKNKKNIIKQIANGNPSFKNLSMIFETQNIPHELIINTLNKCMQENLLIFEEKDIIEQLEQMYREQESGRSFNGGGFVTYFVNGLKDRNTITVARMTNEERKQRYENLGNQNRDTSFYYNWLQDEQG